MKEWWFLWWINKHLWQVVQFVCPWGKAVNNLQASNTLEKKTKLCYCYIGELKPRSTLTCVGRVSWARACKASENGALPALDYGSAALASSTLPKQVSLAGWELCGVTLMLKSLILSLFLFKGLSSSPTSLNVAGRLFS